MKQTLNRFGALLLLLALFLPLYGFNINGAAPGSTASMTPVTCPTGAPTRAAPCATTSAGVQGRTMIEFSNIGTANAYIAPAPMSSPCGAATPAPNASTQAGWWLAPNSVKDFSFTGPNSPWGGLPQVQAQWDVECDGTGSKIGYTDLGN